MCPHIASNMVIQFLQSWVAKFKNTSRSHTKFDKVAEFVYQPYVTTARVICSPAQLLRQVCQHELLALLVELQTQCKELLQDSNCTIVALQLSSRIEQHHVHERQVRAELELLVKITVDLQE